MSRSETYVSKPIVVPLVSVALGVVMLLVAWRAAGDLRLGLWFLGIMTVFAVVLRFGQRFEAVQILSRDHMSTNATLRFPCRRSAGPTPR